MFATFAPRILWFAQRNLWLAPLNAGFAPMIAAFALWIFSKTHQSSLTLKGGSTSHLGLLPSGKKRKPPYSVLVTISFYGWRTIRGLASSRAAVFCAGINPLSLKDLLRGCMVDA